MNGRTAKLLRRAARKAQVNERHLGRQWWRLSGRERAQERRTLQHIVDTLATQRGQQEALDEQMRAIMSVERKRRAESPIVRPGKLVTL